MVSHTCPCVTAQQSPQSRSLCWLPQPGQPLGGEPSSCCPWRTFPQIDFPPEAPLSQHSSRSRCKALIGVNYPDSLTWAPLELYLRAALRLCCGLDVPALLAVLQVIDHLECPGLSAVGSLSPASLLHELVPVSHFPRVLQGQSCCSPSLPCPQTCAEVSCTTGRCLSLGVLRMGSTASCHQLCLHKDWMVQF